MGKTNKGLMALITVAQASMQHISEDVLNKLCDSMPHQVKAVLDAYS